MVIKNLKYLIMFLFFVNPIFAMHDEKYPTEILEAYQLGLFNEEIYTDAWDKLKCDVFDSAFKIVALKKFLDVIKKLREVKEFENTIIKIPYYLDALLIKVSDVNHLNEGYAWYGCNSRKFYELNKKHSAKMEKLDGHCVKLIFNEPKNIYQLQKEYKDALKDYRDAIVELVNTNFQYDESNIIYIDSLNTRDSYGNCATTWYFRLISKHSNNYKRYRLEYSLYENRFTKCVCEDEESWRRIRAEESYRYHSPDCAYCNRHL